MAFKLLLAAVVAAASLVTAPPAQAASPEVIEFADISPKCDGPFDFDKEKGACNLNSGKLEKVTEELCGGPGLVWKNGACTAPDAKNFPGPNCGNAIPDLAYNAKEKNCRIVRETPRSSPGNFAGDCFRVTATPTSDLLQFVPARVLKVQSQSVVNDVKILRVVQAKDGWVFGCSAADKVWRDVRAADLIAAGAERSGWAYGALALPFKYYPGEKSFTSAVALGPYVGWRLSSPGLASTLAIASTIGTVKGEAKDAAGKVSNPDLLSFSVALGAMFDISKADGIKPFKIGLFLGKDWANNDSAVTYKYNGKAWVAFQIGYDFTDN